MIMAIGEQSMQVLIERPATKVRVFLAALLAIQTNAAQHSEYAASLLRI